VKARPKRWWEVRKKGWWRAYRNIPVFLLHQRTTYMDKSERIFHSSMNFLTALVLYLGFLSVDLFSNQWLRIFISLICARTISYFFNDHFWGGLLVSFDSVKNCGTERIRKYLIESQKRLSNSHSIYICTVYGSIIRGEFHDKSDLDVRYIRRPGFLNAISALSFAARERVIALFTRIPLDLYVGDSEKFLNKMREDEIPIVIKDTDGRMPRRCQNYVPFERFLETSH